MTESRMTEPRTTESAAAARSAGLTYTSDERPGIRRLRAGRGFRYVRAGGAPVRDPETLERIRRLAIPPAYRDVWISPDPNGHVQATGRDARGRKQYRYHLRWREVRDGTKFDRMIAFGHALPAIRRRVERDLDAHGLPRGKVLALVVRLLEDTCIRVGSREYARDNESYGLTTLLDEHADVAGSRILFEFRGKRGKEHRCEIRDRRVARLVARCQDLPGEHLFQYVDEEGEHGAVESGDVNAYLRDATGEEFTAKDFRTWMGTLLAAEALLSAEPAPSARRRRVQINAAIDAVAARLHNARAACRKYYVHPSLLRAFDEGELAASFARAASRAPRIRGLSAFERALVAFLAADARRRLRA